MTGFDELVPALEPPLDLVAFALEYTTLFGRLLSEDALRFDEVAKDLTASVRGEKLLCRMRQHGAIENID